MKVAFFFDTVLLKDEFNDYWGMTLTYNFLKERYLTQFNEMIISTRVKDKNKEKGDVSGYKITNGPNVNVKPITMYNDIPDAIANREKIRKQVEDIIKSVDKVIVRMPSVIGMIACECAKKLKKPYIIEMVACPLDGYLNHIRFGGKVLAPIMWYLTRKCVKNCPKVLYVTDSFLQSRYPTKGKSVACSDVVLNDLDDKVLNNRLEKIVDFNHNNVIKLGTVASVGLKYKGQEYVMKAMAELKKKGIKTEYYLAGGGDCSRLNEIAQKLKVQDMVHFLGSLPHDKVFDLYDKIDIYIQPSLQEGLPRALVEAMSRACPAIGSNAGGIPELLNKKYIFKKKDIKRLQLIIESLNSDIMRELAKDNYLVAQRFDKKELIKKRSEFYKNI